MSFFADFEPLPPPTPPKPFKVEPWMGKPQGWLGGWVGWHGTLLGGPDTRVVLEQVLAFPAGVQFELRILRRPSADEGGFDLHRMMMGGGARYGVEFSDGRRCVTRGRPISQFGEPEGPVLVHGGGGGGGGEWRTSLWLWPLPPSGGLRLAATWPEGGCEETVTEFDGNEILSAVADAEHLWEVD
jgi:hypothetical protein